MRGVGVKGELECWNPKLCHNTKSLKAKVSLYFLNWATQDGLFDIFDLDILLSLVSLHASVNNVSFPLRWQSQKAPQLRLWWYWGNIVLHCILNLSPSFISIFLEEWLHCSDRRWQASWLTRWAIRAWASWWQAHSSVRAPSWPLPSSSWGGARLQRTKRTNLPIDKLTIL